MFERFTREARHAVERAQGEARRLGAERIEPEHVLLALASGGVDPAARALAEAGIDCDAIEEAIEQDLVAALAVVGVPSSVVASTPAYPRADKPSFSLQARDVLERSLREAASRDQRRIGTEHLLLGLLSPEAVSVRRVLGVLDVDPQRLIALTEVELASGR